jgi:hypothetical protein
MSTAKSMFYFFSLIGIKYKYVLLKKKVEMFSTYCH